MFERFSKRSHQLERLDTGDYSPAEYARWQKEMWFIHRIFGEIRALRKTVFSEIEQTEGSLSILDVGAGSGELLRKLRQWTADRTITLAGVEINRDATISIANLGVPAVQADGRKLPFANDGFDIVFCSLFLHHLDDKDAAVLLNEMARVARSRIYVLDLNRSPSAYYFYKAFGRFFFQPFTVQDGALSILRSRTPDELAVLARAAGLRDVTVQHSRANRLILSGNK